MKIKVFGIVVMVSVFLHHTFVMDQLIGVTQVGVLTVIMEQMKTSIAAVNLGLMPMIYVILHHTVKMNQHVIQVLKVIVIILQQDLIVMVL